MKTIALLTAPVADARRDNDPLTETTTAVEHVMTSNFIRVNKETVRLPDGSTSTRYCLPHPGAAAMVVYDETDGTIVLERQWRHPLRRAFWEIPAGKIDPNEDDLVCAKRELLEECGIRAESWTPLGRINNAIGYSNEHIELFLAQSLTYGAQQLDPGEFLEVYRVPLAEALAMCDDGRITDVKTIVGLYRLERRLRQLDSKKA